MPEITLEKTTKNDKDLYFGKHDNDIIMVLPNPKHPDKLQFVITEKDEDIKNAKIVDLKPSILLKERGEKDITVQKINQDLKMNLNLKNKEVSKSKNTGIEI